MLKCPELKKLPKAPRFKSVNFRSQTPGTISNLLAPRWPPSRLLDPSHPAASLSRKHFQQHTCDAFRVIAYPMALLSPPDRMDESTRPLDTWKDRMDRLGATSGKAKGPTEFPPMILDKQRATRVSMSFLSTANKKQSKKRVVRLKLGARLKTAINLIAVRGTDVATAASGKRKLVINDQEAKEQGDKWILPGWSYIFHPSLEVYRMPYHDLIPLMRTALRSIWDNGMKLEKKWEAQPLREHSRKPKSVSPNSKRQYFTMANSTEQVPVVLPSEVSSLEPLNDTCSEWNGPSGGDSSGKYANRSGKRTNIQASGRPYLIGDEPVSRPFELGSSRSEERSDDSKSSPRKKPFGRRTSPGNIEPSERLPKPPRHLTRGTHKTTSFGLRARDGEKPQGWFQGQEPQKAGDNGAPAINETSRSKRSASKLGFSEKFDDFPDSLQYEKSSGLLLKLSNPHHKGGVSDYVHMMSNL